MNETKQNQLKKLSVRFAAMLAMTSIPPPQAHANDLTITEMSTGEIHRFFAPVADLRFVSRPITPHYALALVRFVESPAWGNDTQLSRILYRLSRIRGLGIAPALAIPSALQAIYESDLASGGYVSSERAVRAVTQRTEYADDDPYASYNDVVHAERLRALAIGADGRLPNVAAWRSLAVFFSSASPSWRLPLFVGPIDDRLRIAPGASAFGVFLLEEGLRLGGVQSLSTEELSRFKAAMATVRTSLYRDRHDPYRMARFVKLHAQVESLHARFFAPPREIVCRGYALVGY